MSRYNPRIWGVVVANSRQRRDAEEILMDIWMAVWENINGLRKVDSFSGWLRRIAYNACNRYYASARHSQNETPQRHPELIEHIDRDATVRFRETQLNADVKEVVQHLPQRVRRVAVLYYLESWSMKEIAEELNLAIGTVKTKLRETRGLLRKEFRVAPEKGGIMSPEFADLHNKSGTCQTCPAYQRRVRWKTNRKQPYGGYLKMPVSDLDGVTINTMVLSPNGEHLAAGTHIGLWWYETSTLSPIALWGTDCERISAIAFSASGEWVATGHEDGSVKVWDVAARKLFNTSGTARDASSL